MKETDAIVEQLAHRQAPAQADPSVRRESLDAKASVNIGPFSRHGKPRVHLQSADHDFRPEAMLTPSGIFLPAWEETSLYLTASKITADCMVDGVRDFWLTVRGRFPQVKTLLLNLDSGPENHSRRTQFMARLTALADEFGLTFQLAYSPPDHSKDHPIERVWGVLEQHWNGQLLNSCQTVLRLASTMTYHGFAPVVKVVEKPTRPGFGSLNRS